MAKPQLRAAARQMRRDGLTYDEIVARLGVSKSSVSLWVRDIKPAETLERVRRRKAHVKMMAEARWSAYRVERDARRDRIRSEAADTVPTMSRDELIRLGALLYWCEGSKDKPWSGSKGDVAFINSDPVLIDLFLCFLRVVGVSQERIAFRVHIHESADVEAAVYWWADRVGVSSSSFQRTVLKRHNPRTVRKNTGDDYRGCLIIRVRRSRELYWRIEGLMAGIHRAAQSDPGS